MHSDSRLSPHHQPHPRMPRSISLWYLDRFLSKDASYHGTSIYRHMVHKKASVTCARYSAPGLTRPHFHDVVGHADFQACASGVGESYGPGWSSHWLKVDATVPTDWEWGEEWEWSLTVDAGCEAAIYDANGRMIQGITCSGGDDRHVDIILPLNQKRDRPETHFVVYIELACNAMFGLGEGGDINPPNTDRTFRMSILELRQVWKPAKRLVLLMEILREAAREMENTVPGAKAMADATDAASVFHADDRESVYKALSIIERGWLGAAGRQPRASPSMHDIIAIGNCHIDTAWLWPYDETKRKVARSWSRQVRWMERNANYKFAASQAQQFAWLEQDYPEVFDRVKERVKTGQFIPIGGTWVEMDCNIPSGESLCRQFLHGQNYFKSRFGMHSDVFWLPDTFGYAAQLPQIVLQSGAKYFFTQKLSWNNINKFPNTTFFWVGLDGSQVLTHMAPSETYVAQCRIGELKQTISNNKDLSRTSASLLLYGNGDGGGGPLVPMLDRLELLQDREGLPSVNMGTPSDFYKRVEEDAKRAGDAFTKWNGELYFELHRGTYTSHAITKRWNRKCELALRDAEHLSVLAALRQPRSSSYPAKELKKAWEMVLLNQFHDVLPGSSIGIVYDDAVKLYEQVDAILKEITHRALDTLSSHSNASDKSLKIAFNTLPWARIQVVNTALVEGAESNEDYALAELPPNGFACIQSSVKVEHKVSATLDADGNFVLRNQYLQAKFDAGGRLVSLMDLAEDRETIQPGESGNLFVLYEDQPIFWDAWDVEIYHLQTGRTVPPGNVKIQHAGPVRCSLEVITQITKTSRMRQVISLDSLSRRLEFTSVVHWDEDRKLLKVEFPFNIRSDHATYETQFGHIRRPTHYNTSWDYAKFEVCGHKWADLSEYGYGVSLLNDCKYGYSTRDNVMAMSLLRAPRKPDPNCDIGVHHFRYALYPHSGSFYECGVVRQAYEFNVPLIVRPAKKDVGVGTTLEKASSLGFRLIGGRNVILDTIKMAETAGDDQKVVVARMYESMGGHATIKLVSPFTVKKATRCNILEEDQEELQVSEHDINDDTDSVHYAIPLALSAFQVVTVKLVLV